MIPLILASALAATSPCDGFYSYLPTDREAEIAFSVEVQPTALAISYLDYGRLFAERQNRPDGIIQVFDSGPGGVNYWLACSGEVAFLTVDQDEYHSMARVYRLVRTQGDIWAVAQIEGWDIDD